MSRKSKYTNSNTAVATAKNMWRAGLYIRLSRDDGDKEESDSVANQRALLLDFISAEIDILAGDIYIDDGWSGTNFDRPDFQRMINDLKDGTINCVIVKDLSRFGRNYIDVGQYIEKIFPFLDVRFISVNDMLDSFKNPQSMNNLVVPFKNLINDEYCRDISNKVRSSLDMKRRQGKFIGSFASYGYMKDCNDHNHLVIDTEAAEVVRNIFDWFVSGMSIISITRKLNALGILNPSAYKRSQGTNYRHPQESKNDHLWCDASVRRILRNRVYTGCMVQGKNKIKSYKVQISITVPEDDWIVVPGTHEPVVSLETFDTAQNLFQRDTRTAPGNNHVYLFSGFIKCADCGRAMNRKTVSNPNKKYSYYICSTFKKMEKGACTKHTVRSDDLEAAVLETLRRQIDLAVSMDKLISAINSSLTVNKGSLLLENSLSAKEREREKLERFRLSLYSDWKNGDITKNDYHKLKAGFEDQISVLDAGIENVRSAISEAESGVDGTNAFISGFIKNRNLEKLSREVLLELVENIYIHEGGSITIKFKFADAFLKANEFIEQNQPLSSPA